MSASRKQAPADIASLPDPMATTMCGHKKEKPALASCHAASLLLLPPASYCYGSLTPIACFADVTVWLGYRLSRKKVKMQRVMNLVEGFSESDGRLLAISSSLMGRVQICSRSPLASFPLLDFESLRLGWMGYTDSMLAQKGLMFIHSSNLSALPACPSGLI